MILVDVMEALGTALEACGGLRVKSYTEQRVNPPQAQVNLPRSYRFDETFARGSDDVEIPITVFVGRYDAESSRNAIGQYVDGSGGVSVKEAVETYTSTAYDIAHVIDVQFLVTTVAGIEYLTATFRVRVIGKG